MSLIVFHYFISTASILGILESIFDKYHVISLTPLEYSISP